ncbi:MAG: T9SS type A sorting domain-containing protein, partial [Desulfobacteraceae bacterium]|nr:T9SS type A sorting domain-containing protein [Desulfobacteraceae bacterium]
CADIYVLDDTVFVMDGTSIQMYRLTDTGIDEAYYLDVAGRISFIDVYPNPFKQITTIKFQVPGSKFQIPSSKSQITMSIYDVSGRLVKDFSHLTLDAQRPSLLSWDGTDDDGKELAQGIYFIKLKVEGTSYTKKVILLK